jgi:hypothetical protein
MLHDKHIYLTTFNIVLFLLHFYPVRHYSYKLKAGILIETKPAEDSTRKPSKTDHEEPEKAFLRENKAAQDS